MYTYHAIHRHQDVGQVDLATLVCGGAINKLQNIHVASALMAALEFSELCVYICMYLEYGYIHFVYACM
jgi:hypothetical protein